MSKNDEGPLVVAARRLDEELRRFETLSKELRSAAINSEKSLHRARQALEQCAEHESRLGESLQGFAQAMQSVQQTQQACMQLIADGAKHVAERHRQRAELQERIAELGERARGVSEPVARLGEIDNPAPAAMLQPLDDVERRLEAVIGEASTVCELAQQGDWNDLQRDTQSLREQLQAMRNRVLLTRRKLGSAAPS